MLQQLQLPAVVIGGPGDTGEIAQIWSDDAGAITEAVRYLVALGHRRIARVGGLPDLLHTQTRTKAFDEVCAALGLVEAITVPSDYTGEEGGRATRRLLIDADRPTAIIYDNDVMAVAGLAVAQEMGLSVPGDLSIVAWDDSPLCSLVHPPLTALSRDIAEYGAHAARELLAAIDGKQVGNVEAGTAHLTPRGSTAPPAELTFVTALAAPLTVDCPGTPRSARPAPGGPARNPGRRGSRPGSPARSAPSRLQPLGHDLQAEPAAQADHHVDHRRAAGSRRRRVDQRRGPA